MRNRKDIELDKEEKMDIEGRLAAPLAFTIVLIWFAGGMMITLNPIVVCLSQIPMCISIYWLLDRIHTINKELPNSEE